MLYMYERINVHDIAINASSVLLFLRDILVPMLFAGSKLDPVSHTLICSLVRIETPQVSTDPIGCPIVCMTKP
jgi:hypothetical protein